MTDLDKMTDRDILVRLDKGMELLEPRIERIDERVHALELRAATQSGFFGGAKALWAILGALPASVVVYFLGAK